MREILFRGKRIDTGEWIVGQLIRYEDGRTRIVEAGENIFCYEMDISIIQTVARHVAPETVGQYTGLCDKNGKKIFEGDIVKFLRYVGKIVFENGAFGLGISFNEEFDWDYIDEEMKEFTGVAQFCSCFNDHFISLWEILWNCNCDHNDCDVVEVIGNIHDNQALLEVSHE